MEQGLHKVLLIGEKIIWKEKAAPFRLLEAPYTTMILITWIVCAAIAVSLPMLHISTMVSQGLEVKKLVVAVFIAAPLYFALKPVFDKRKIEKKATYVITNLRAIAFFDGDDYHSICLDQIASTCVDSLPNGSGIIWMGDGKACKKHAWRSRILTIIGQKSSENETTGLVFYSVKNAGKVCENFLKHPSYTKAS